MNVTQPKGLALVVDDDADSREQLVLYLEQLGFTVRSAASQAEGEQLIESLEPRLAVFDLMLEHHDSGFVLAHRMKRKAPDVPVILVTAVAAETGMRFNDAGPRERSWVKADVVLDKGIRFEQLKREVERLLG
jgi:CheY-like chemotaxis protein